MHASAMPHTCCLPLCRQFVFEDRTPQAGFVLLAEEVHPLLVPLPSFRYPWTDEKLAAAPPRATGTQQPKPPRPLVVTYPFSTDDQLREHVSGAKGCTAWEQQAGGLGRWAGMDSVCCCCWILQAGFQVVPDPASLRLMHPHVPALSASPPPHSFKPALHAASPRFPTNAPYTLAVVPVSLG